MRRSPIFKILENRKQRLVARMEIIEKIAAQSGPEIVHLFDELVEKTVPEGIYLTQIKENRQEARDEGRCPVEARARVDFHAQYRFVFLDG